MSNFLDTFSNVEDRQDFNRNDITINIVVAVGLNGQIGLNNKIPWFGDESINYKKDLQNFRELTTGTVMVCGYKTYPQVKHLHLTHNRVLIVDTSDNMKEIFDLVRLRHEMNPEINPLTISVIGGAKTYDKWMKSIFDGTFDNCSDLVIHKSIIPYDGPADTYFTEDNDEEYEIERYYY